MSKILASDDVYSKTSRWMMTWGGESVFRKAQKKKGLLTVACYIIVQLRAIVNL